MNKLRLIIFCLLGAFIFVSFDADAQRYKKRSDDTSEESVEEPEDAPLSEQKLIDRLTFGGNFGASFGTNTYIDLSPMVGYRITKKLTAGVGGTYIYYNLLRGYFDPNTGSWVGSYRIKGSMYGGRGFGQFNITDNFYAYSEYEALNVPFYDYYTQQETRTWIGNPFVGGGYRTRIGQRSFFNITALYNLNFHNNFQKSPYGSPWQIRMGFSL